MSSPVDIEIGQLLAVMTVRPDHLVWQRGGAVGPLPKECTNGETVMARYSAAAFFRHQPIMTNIPLRAVRRAHEAGYIEPILKIDNADQWEMAITETGRKQADTEFAAFYESRFKSWKESRQ